MTGQPRFWYQRRGLAATSLTPLSWLWQLGGLTRRRLTRPSPSPCPLICVGNLTIGGVGKTPLVAHLATLAHKAGKSPVILSHGYGGRVREARQVTDADSATLVGDEAVELYLHARGRGKVVVAGSRVAGLKLASQLGDIVIMDDGFQNPSIVPTRSVLVFDGWRGIGNRAVIPAGPMRETLAGGLHRAGYAVIIGEDATGLASRIKTLVPQIRLAHAQKTFTKQAKATIKQSPLLAFAGIGDPANFFALLGKHGGRLAQSQSFPDHHPYTASEVARLITQAEAAGLTLVTTMKDYVRLPQPARQHITPLGMQLDIDPRFCRRVLFGD